MSLLAALSCLSHLLLSANEVLTQLLCHRLVNMASIKERAAALNLADKLCVRPQGEFIKHFQRGAELSAAQGGLFMTVIIFLLKIPSCYCGQFPLINNEPQFSAADSN